MNFRSLFVVSKREPQHNKQQQSLSYLVTWLFIIAIIVGIFYFSFKDFPYTFHWDTIREYRDAFVLGFQNTIIVSLVALVLSAVIGVVAGVARSSEILAFRLMSTGYIELIRNTPLIVQILIFFYVVANALQYDNRFVVGIIIMSLFAGAYMAEIIRAGIESIEGSHLETAESLGFTRLQTYRYVIFPQIIRRTLPGMAGQFVSLIKDSSLLSIISVREFTMVARDVSSASFTTLEAYLFIAAGYVLLTFPVSMLMKYLEKIFSIEKEQTQTNK